MNCLILLSCVMVALVGAKVGHECTSNTECAEDECCQILSEFMIVSKRAKSGTCQKYIPEGKPCDIFGKRNGYCSCFPGYVCHAVEVPIGDVHSHGHMRMIIAPRPGYKYDIKCVQDIAK